jgi:hypothetical protein
LWIVVVVERCFEEVIVDGGREVSKGRGVAVVAAREGGGIHLRCFLGAVGFGRWGGVNVKMEGRGREDARL